MNIQPKYVDSVTNICAYNKKAVIVTDYIRIEKYSAVNGGMLNGKDHLEIPLSVRSDKSKFRRTMKLSNVDFIINWLRNILLQNPNEIVWINIISLFCDKDHNELSCERHLCLLANSSNFEEKKQEISEALRAFCQDSDLIDKETKKDVKLKKRG